jgi:hypothetical protein
LLARDDAISSTTSTSTQTTCNTYTSHCMWVKCSSSVTQQQPTGTAFQTCYVRKKASKQARKNKQTNKHGSCIFSLHILPYNVGNKISWVKNYYEVVVVVARNPSCCSKSQSVYRFCGDAEGDKLRLQQQQYLSKLFTKRPKLVDSQQGERTVPQGKLTVLHSPSPTQNTTKKETLGQFLGSFFVLSRTQC